MDDEVDTQDRKRILEQLVNRSCYEISCTNCPIVKCGGHTGHLNCSSHDLPKRIADEANKMLFDLVIEEFLGE